MKKPIFTLLLLFLISSGIRAQINLIGASGAQDPDVISVVKWQALDSASVISYPTPLNAYVFGSSVFDAWNSNYHLTGITADTSGLLSFNTETNTATISDYRTYSSITEIDMSTGKIYNLTSDSAGYFSVNEYDLKTGEDSLLGVIYEPGILGIIADATGFDSNNGILYYAGYDSTNAHCLYGIPVRNTEFSYSKIILSAEGTSNNFTGLNYDNVNNTLFARNARFDSTWSYTGSYVVEINKTTGEVVTRGSLEAFPYFVAGSSSFDQNSGSFMIIGIDTSNMLKMIVFDTYSNTYQAGFVPGNVSEIVCDNSSFARSTYATTAVQKTETTEMTVFPNPASETITIAGFPSSAGKVRISILNLNGQMILQQDHQAGAEIRMNVGFLNAGLYLIRMVSNHGTETLSLMIR